MATPQSILYNIDYKVEELNTMLRGSRGVSNDEEELYYGNIYDLILSLQKTCVVSSERMIGIEDRLNLIIKLLGKK